MAIIDINIPIEDAVTDGSLNPVTSNAVFDALALKANSADLATVATSGDYNDLSNLPSIPAAQVNADWNATSGVAEILNKPTIPSVTGFVPYTGATNDVDLGVHDLTATQGTFATSGNPDTLTVNHSSGSGKALTITKGGNGEGVYVNKTSGSGNAVTVIGDLEATNLKRTGGTSSQFLKANGSIDSTSYQPTLVSGTNIKTVNGNSLLGSGDLVISGGGGAIAVGTTAVTSGTVGRVFFQGTGDVVQQSGSLFWDNTNSRLGVGATPATTVRLDVRAQGALSTDIAFRVRNSADSADTFSIRGNGDMYFPQPISSGQNIIYIANTSDTLLRYLSSSFGSLAIGQNATVTNGSYYNTVIGSGSSAGSLAEFAVSLGFSTVVNSKAIGIGDRVRTSGTDTIVIGNTSGATAYSGTRSIHLGRKGNFGNDISADDVFMTYFNSDNSSTLTRANGSFGLLGKGAYILSNGTGTFGTETFMGNGGNTLVVRNHASIPSTNVADSFQQYSADIVAGNAAPHFRTENGNIIKLYQQSSAGITTVGQLVTVLQNLGLLS